ncbi:MAG: hypothetical protein KBA81_01205 [Rhabdochlamydiaceae bacterium]|nr:hypothetical protein [Rhabdochlamydiaceae bacterium]
MINAVGERFEVLLLNFNKGIKEAQEAEDFLKSKGITNIVITTNYALKVAGIDWTNKRVLVMLTDHKNSRNLELFSSMIGHVNASCKQGKGHFLCYNAASDHNRIATECATSAEIGKYLYVNDPSYDAVFEAWRRRCTIEELNIDKGVATTPLFWRVFNPVGVFAVMAIIAGIFAAKRGYFSNLFSSQSWLKLN